MSYKVYAQTPPEQYNAEGQWYAWEVTLNGDTIKGWHKGNKTAATDIAKKHQKRMRNLQTDSRAMRPAFLRTEEREVYGLHNHGKAA